MSLKRIRQALGNFFIPTDKVRWVRVIYMGGPEYVIGACEALHQSTDHNLVATITPPARRKGRNRTLEDSPLALWARATMDHLPHLSPERVCDEKMLDVIRNLAPDVIITAAYGQILSDAFLALPPYGVINIHPSLLPRHRGATPVPQAFLSGDTTTGVSVIKTVSALDAGPIICSQSVEILPQETSKTLLPRLFDLAAKLLLSALERVQDPAFKPTPQSTEGVSYSQKLTKAHGLMDFSKGARELERRYRAFDPWPGSYVFFRKKRMMLTDITLHPSSSSPPLPPCRFAYDHHSKTLRVGTRDSDLELRVKRIKREGRSWLEAHEFICGLSSQNIPVECWRFDD